MMHISSMKSATKGKKIESVAAPDLLLIPLLERFGSKPEPVVSPGDRVRRYQLLAESSVGFPSRVHSPISGTVEKIEEHLQADGFRSVTVFVRNDGKNTEADIAPADTRTDDPEQLLRLIGDAGIVGLGGAQFPTAVKYDRKGKPVRTFIVNGAECEPYLTADYALMSQHTERLLEGILIIDRILAADEIVIGFENSDRELDDIFGPLLADDRYRKIRTMVLPDEYPQGGELQIARTVTGIEIPRGVLPLDKGVVVSNVGTVIAVYEAVALGRPVVDRVLTVSGERVERPGNYRVMVGTPLEHILETGSLNPNDTLIVAGGPMMSPKVVDLTVPVNKGTIGIVALSKKHIDRSNCIWCGYCADVCPMRLMPMKYDQFFRRGKYLKMEDYSIEDCIECGACEYICPAKVPLIESIKEGKAKLKQMKNAARR